MYKILLVIVAAVQKSAVFFIKKVNTGFTLTIFNRVIIITSPWHLLVVVSLCLHFKFNSLQTN